jgi:hypothetical protein
VVHQIHRVAASLIPATPVSKICRIVLRFSTIIIEPCAAGLYNRRQTEEMEADI